MANRPIADSTIGKIIEKAGSVLKSDKVEEKGHAKRETAAYGRDNDDSYGSSRKDNDSSYGSSRRDDDNSFGSSRRDDNTGFGSSGRGNDTSLGSGRRDNDDSYGSSRRGDDDSYGSSNRRDDEFSSGGLGSGERTGGYGQDTSYSSSGRDNY